MLSPARILIAEDDHTLRSMLVLMLRHFHPDVHIFEAPNGQSAHHLYQQHGADIIITDNHMPIMTGVELVNTLRGDGVQTPIVLVSSNPPRRDVFSFDDRIVFLSKPVSIQQLLTTITQLVPALC